MLEVKANKSFQDIGKSLNSKNGKPLFYNDLRKTYTELWTLLRLGVKDRRSPLHTPSLASVRGDGSPTLRTVVLREADASSRTLRFHTDARSAKFREITANPRVALHFYDPDRKIQLRVDGRASIHTRDDYATEVWRKMHPFSRLCYKTELAPGVSIEDPSDIATPLVGMDDRDGRENFSAVSVRMEQVEWLYLAARGHRRARYSWQADQMLATWLAP